MPRPTFLLTCLILPTVLAFASPVWADVPAPPAPDNPHVDPAEVPTTTQEWYERLHTLTREMTPEEVVVAIGREPDSREPNVNGRVRWTYFYQNPNRPDHTNRVWVFFRDGKFYSW